MLNSVLNKPEISGILLACLFYLDELKNDNHEINHYVLWDEIMREGLLLF